MTASRAPGARRAHATGGWLPNYKTELANFKPFLASLKYPVVQRMVSSGTTWLIYSGEAAKYNWSKLNKTIEIY